MDLLCSINSPEDLKKLGYNELEQLSNEVRQFLVDNVSKTGGHLASNLGVVELSLALHRVFDSPRDKIVWDVGHQSYVHKIITGRKDHFCSLRQLDGMSGFPKTNESCHDCFNTGHSSTSISAALGMARARDIKNEVHSVISIIGDGALTGGMAFEALNDAGRASTDITVILNDNEMSISKNVGGLSKYLSKVRTEPFYFKVKEDIDLILNKIPAIGKSAARALDLAKGTIKYIITPGIIFEELGFKYLGPIDGHNIHELNKVLARSQKIKGPIVIHICTMKGKGYTFAEANPHSYHGVSPFEIETGEAINNKSLTFSKVFGDELVSLAQKDENIVAVTAAMPDGTGLNKFAGMFKNRFFDVGIAEQHAVTMGAGLAKSGMKPVIAIYSSFMQRAYDQIWHDVCLQNLHVVLAIDRAGIVGEDGETHQGIYDLSFLRHMPNMTIMAPSDYAEFKEMLKYSLFEHKGPIAVRYPKGNGRSNTPGNEEKIKLGRGSLLSRGKDLTIISAGTMLDTAVKVSDVLYRSGIKADLINSRFIKPYDEKLIVKSVMKTGLLITLEDNVKKGGFGSGILEMISEYGLFPQTKIFGFPDELVTHGSKEELFKKYRLDTNSIVKSVINHINNNRRIGGQIV